ncbi:type IV pilus biogenesis protein PilN [Syntrophotalea carbinolica DSM 2380]|uniref:Type IV pilus biogenesis protein PilN n=1 Tax=Syntrophotalea carbinolica (strain DSM 2380 / NBRC 103641 / GraBd1) TaxID=338963 RepID=Q3A2N1_SYNC1|nr:PilN domain-containing protein [Syntrophotalea carbinolica]ABA89376.1 type IV pilus biogenesis protein PilN [Syntrophotalea carbinolica DSM 2380]
MIRINLLPVRAAQKRARFQREIFFCVVAVVFALLVCSALYVQSRIKIAGEKALIAEYNKEIASLKSVLGEVAEFKKKQTEYQDKLNVLADLKRKKNGPIHLLDDLNRALPDKLWLESFQEESGGVKIKGVGVSEKSVAGFITALESSPYFRDVDLKVTKQVEQDGVKLQSFEIYCKQDAPPIKVSGKEGSKI